MTIKEEKLEPPITKWNYLYNLLNQNAKSTDFENACFIFINVYLETIFRVNLSKSILKYLRDRQPSIDQ